MMWGNEGGYGMFFGPLFMILILAATIAAIVFLVRWLSGAQQGFGPASLTPPVQTPLDILKERPAKGEISKKEVDERRRFLDD